MISLALPCAYGCGVLVRVPVTDPAARAAIHVLGILCHACHARELRALEVSS